MNKLGVLFLVVAAAFVVAVTAMSRESLAHVGEWLIYASLPAANGFVLVYGLTRPWYRSQIGRALFTKAVGVAALFDLSAISHATDWRVPTDLAVLVVGLIVFGIWYQFLVLLSTRGGRDDPR